ncbi:GNAT family N-acetyltransferase [Streptomyces sp. NPDC048516]|uniref:GNAT family N-acetyltransferase n=1 Tax=Streptomyces sp. NPDC048516 TaxID=3365565 RepID=UPI0037158376
MSAAIAESVTAMRPDHADQVPAIYQLGIDEGNATFETTARPGSGSIPPSCPSTAQPPSTPAAGSWAAVVPVSDRCACPASSNTPSTSAPNARGSGVGLTLLQALFASTDAAGSWTVQSGIFPGCSKGHPAIRRTTPGPGRADATVRCR